MRLLDIPSLNDYYLIIHKSEFLYVLLLFFILGMIAAVIIDVLHSKVKKKNKFLDSLSDKEYRRYHKRFFR